MIFLGAGASKPLGVPTLQELSKIVIEELKNRGHSKLLGEIESCFNEFNLTMDFEHLYSVIEGLNDPIESVKRLGGMATFFVKYKKNLPQKYDFDSLLLDLKNIIYDNCVLNIEKVKKLNELYDPLFDILSKNFNILQSNTIIGNNDRGPEPLTKYIVTTNYDMSMELYLNIKERKFIDGYDLTNNTYIKRFNRILFDSLCDPHRSIGEIVLIKLHGSIWQFVNEGCMIKTTIDPKINPPIPLNVEKEMMIYPTTEKEILSQYYFPFFSLFKNIRWTKLLVIGYSFRDKPINEAIMENIINIQNSKIIIIHPDVDYCLKNLYEYTPKNIRWNIPVDRVHKINGKFGSDEVIRELEKIPIR